MNPINYNEFIDLVRRNLQNRKKNGMKPLSKDKEDSIVDGLAEYYNVLQTGRSDDLLLVDTLRALSNLGTVQHMFTVDQANHTFVLADCAEAYAYVMYFIPKILKLDREDFMYRVTEEAITMCADYNEFQDLRESESFTLFSVSILENLICTAKITGQYRFSQIIYQCARCISVISILLDKRNIEEDTFEVAVETVLRIKDKDASKLDNAMKKVEMPRAKYKMRFGVFPEGGKIY